MPIESILVTSSYVRVPPIVTFPVNVAATPVKFVIEILGLPDNPPAVPLALPYITSQCSTKCSC